MSKRSELAVLTGLEDEEIERLMRQVKWLDDALRKKGITFKSLADIEDELPNLNKQDLKKIYMLVGKLLAKDHIIARDKPVLGKKVIKLTYTPDVATKSSRYHPTASEILSQKGSEGVGIINALRGRAEKSVSVKTALQKTCAEGIEEIERIRGLVRKRKGAGRYSMPQFEITKSNLRQIDGIREILAHRERRKKGGRI